MNRTQSLPTQAEELVMLTLLSDKDLIPEDIAVNIVVATGGKIILTVQQVEGVLTSCISQGWWDGISPPKLTGKGRYALDELKSVRNRLRE